MANFDKDLVLKNIQNLKNYLKDNQLSSLKLLENIGCFPYVIKLATFNDYGINLTIQINDDLDLSKSTTISSLIKKGSQNEQRTNLFDEFLNEKIKTIDSKSDIFMIKLFQKSQNYVEKNFVRINENLEKKSPARIKQIRKKTDDEADSSSKKAPMKTAGDVVNRIQWDEEINKEFITVGYIDRFLGLKECSFSTFDWGDIVLADYGALAIPEHRISYFKYKDETIWDKKSRLDNIFGSTGSSQTIRDVINRLENLEFQPKNETPSEQLESKIKKIEHENPNYFISIPINSFQIKSSFDLLNSDLLEYNDQVESFLVPDLSFHLTLCTLRIENEQDLNEIKELMNDLKEIFRQNFPIKIRFQGLEQFYRKVLYVKCFGELEKLEYIQKTFLGKFEEKNINMAGNYYTFVPHLTALKINSNSNNRSLTLDDFVDENLLKKYENFKFGEEIINQIQLCKMTNIIINKVYPIEHEITI